MVYRFLLISDEVEGFKREIQINADDTFYSLHNEIIKSVGYQEGEMASFFICSDDWEKEQEITLVEMDTDADQDSYTMESTLLETFLEDEKQRLMYVFDYMTERGFFMELREIILGKTLDKPLCTQSIGEAPAQFVDFEEEMIVAPVATDTDTSFYGDEDFNLDELDDEGFDGLDNVISAEEL